MIRLFFYTLTVATPIAIWLGGAGQPLTFDGVWSTFTTITRIAALAGISMYAGNLILSGRYRFLDRHFGGLDKLYSFHHEVGIYTFALLTLHAATASLRGAGTNFLAFHTLLGEIAFVGFTIIIFLTILASRKIKYERLKNLHSWLGAVFFLGGLHAFLIPSDISRNPVLRWYILALVVLGLLSWLWRTALGRHLVKHFRLQVEAVNILSQAPQVTEVIMGGALKPAFLPGQFVFVRFLQNGFPAEEHPFSLTASAADKNLRISAKALGDFTTELAKLKPGAQALIQGPFGGFTPLTHTKNKRQLWLAGGIGITPFMSAIRTWRDSVDDSAYSDFDIVLIWSVKDPGELIYRQELEEIAANHRLKFQFIPWITKEQGLLTAEKTDYADRDIFVCGPAIMFEALQSQFKSLKVPSSRLHSELFSLL